MKPRQVLGKYLEVYGQGNPITPEAGKKRAPFLAIYFQLWQIFDFIKLEKKMLQIL